MTDQGPAPTPWELMRGIDRLEKAIKDVGANVVPMAVYAADQRGNADRHARSEARIKELETSVAEAEKLRRQQRLTISLAIASPIVAFALTFLRGMIP